MKTLPYLLAIALVLSGCGYKLGEIRPTPMRSVRTLAVPNFKNKTYSNRVESLGADTLIKALQRDGTYQVVGTDEADAIVYVSINNVERRALRSVQNDVLATSEFGLVITASYEVQDRLTGAILQKGEARGRTSFFTGGDLQTIERQALSLAIADLASEISVAVSEGW